jgi:hypothetical protein
MDTDMAIDQIWIPAKVSADDPCDSLTLGAGPDIMLSNI